MATASSCVCICSSVLSTHGFSRSAGKAAALAARRQNSRRRARSSRSYASVAAETVRSLQASDPVSSAKPATPANLEALVDDLRALLVESSGSSIVTEREGTSTEGQSKPAAAALGQRHLSFGPSDSIEQERAWQERLDRTAAALSPQASLDGAGYARRTRIAVLAESQRQAREFTLALLDDPLATKQEGNEYLRGRVGKAAVRSDKGKGKESIVRYGDSLLQMQEDEDLGLPSAWLSENNVEVVELVQSDPSAPIATDTWTSLYASDVVICLSQPADKGDLTRLTRKQNVILATPERDGSVGRPSLPSSLIASGASTSTIDISRVLAPATTTLDTTHDLPRVVLDPALANEANALFRSNGNALSSSGSDFSSLLLTSGFPQLRQYLDELLHSSLNGPASASSPASISKTSQAAKLHLQTALSCIEGLIWELSSCLVHASSFLHQANQQLAVLELKTAREKMHTRIELGFTDLGKIDLEALVNDTPRYTQNKRLAAESEEGKKKEEPEAILLEDGKKDVETALMSKRLAWWKLPLGRADDIAPALTLASGSYFAGLERKLIFETGRLSARTIALSQDIDGLFKRPGAFAAPSSPKNELSLYSAPTHNALLQRSPSTAYGFPPSTSHSVLNNVVQTSLSQPILARRANLVSAGGIIEKLQLRAQQAVLQFYGIAGGSTALAVFASQTPNEALNVLTNQTALGVGALGTVLAMWRLQGKWEKAKKRFWGDWHRAQEGLSFDLQENADHVLEERVFQKANYAKSTLKAQLQQRMRSLKEIEEKLKRSQEDVRSIRQTR